MRGGKVFAGTAALLAALSLLPTAAGLDPPPPPPPAVAPFFLAPGTLLSRVHAASARDDEFVEIANTGWETADLSGWGLSDGEARALFPYGTTLPPGARLVATRNATSFEEEVLQPADFTWDLGDAPHMEGGVLRLADTGDEVLLLDEAGALVDAYAFGASPYAGPGWTGTPARALGRGGVAVRASSDGRLVDRDTALDWDGLRDVRIGQSEFDARTHWTTGAVLGWLSPEDGREPLLALIGSARSSIEAAVYTLGSDSIASAFAEAATRGVRVRILLDGSPVGGLDEALRDRASGLAWFGAEVRWLRGDSDTVKRYRYLHAKYAIVDEARVLVTSENLGDSGFPARGSSGNRGWTAVLEGAEVAADLREVFEEDFDPRRRDSIPVEPLPRGNLTDDVGPPPWPTTPPSDPRRARLVIGPDTSLDPEGVLHALQSARSRIWIEVFYLETTWRDRPNPYLEAAFEASRRQVDVRVLLDGSWWNDDPDEEGNDDVVRRLNARATAEGARLEARLVEPYGRVDRVHNKGVVVDGTTVLVSSMNWAHASATENREIGILIDDPRIAMRFEAALREDWDRVESDAFRLDDPVAVAAVYAIVAVASLVSLLKLRQSPTGLRRHGRMGARVHRGLLRRRGREVRLLPADVVAEPESRPRGRRETRRGRRAARGDRGGPGGD